MRLSRPVAILAFLAIALAVTGLVKPAPQPPTHRSVLVPNETYDKLTQWTKTHTGADGRQRSVVEAIDALATQ